MQYYYKADLLVTIFENFRFAMSSTGRKQNRLNVSVETRLKRNLASVVKRILSAIKEIPVLSGTFSVAFNLLN